ncbi:ABC transporter permease [Brachybacterium saurashtrense]|uniref:ABC transporter permease n=1 Tax=Brachybacterium saurashtrense TaxID=556288 RepID=A0A345YSD9_9MICO|nr:ABC transporter permease [Brachybacterium saurashtrense]AXK46841.1 ABC transporter permease [Brachybacterium saurashtrense]RRR22556.1 ABC transporter permease [Brachybacterium saurashtrense]
MTGFLASIVEAYGELRVHKGRILLSLIGVAFSVFALTVVMGAGGMLGGALQQSMEKSSGRDTLLSIQPLGGMDYSIDAEGNIVEQSSGSAKEVTPAEQDAIVLEQLDRLGITQRSRQAYVSTRIQTPQGVVSTELTGVDPAYGAMYRVQIAEGRWLADSDHRRLAPALVVNQPLYEQLGRPDLGTETITLYGQSGTREKEIATVVGVMVADPSTDWAPQAYLAVGGIAAVPGVDPSVSTTSQYLAWVPPEQGEEVRQHLAQRLSDTAAGSFEVHPTSFGMEQMQVFSMFGYAIAGVAVVILLLGAMGLVNISLVTVRYRVREIGIRRSYGATGGRIFVGVLMESVVATVIAGAVGVAAAVALVKAPFVTDVFTRAGLVDLPPFPVGAVITGLAAATAVGVLAGALPALIATRIRVIDAIRS